MRRGIRRQAAEAAGGADPKPKPKTQHLTPETQHPEPETIEVAGQPRAQAASTRRDRDTSSVDTGLSPQKSHLTSRPKGHMNILMLRMMPSRIHLLLWGPKDHINMRILHAGSIAQDNGTPEAMVYRILMFMWPFGSLLLGLRYFCL